MYTYCPELNYYHSFIGNLVLVNCSFENELYLYGCKIKNFRNQPSLAVVPYCEEKLNLKSKSFVNNDERLKQNYSSLIDYDVRLYSSKNDFILKNSNRRLNEFSGIVQIYYDNFWYLIEPASLTSGVTNTFCNYLGFKGGEMTNENYTSIFAYPLFRLNCSGENFEADCHFQRQYFTFNIEL